MRQTTCRNAPQVKDVEEYAAAQAQEVDIQVRVLANELRGHDITVNAVAPGPVGTELFITGKTEEQIDQLRRLSPLERLGQPEDIANVISFLAGQDGGLHQMDRSFVLMEVLYSNLYQKRLQYKRFQSAGMERWASFLFLLSTDMLKKNWLWDRIRVQSLTRNIK